MARRPRRDQAQGASAQLAKEADQRRGSAHSRGYDREWRDASAAHRAAYPLCQYCEIGAFGDVRVSAADLTDHLYPHKGDRRLFWRAELWVSSCTSCHSGPKQATEHRGQGALDQLARRLGRPTL